LAQHRGANVARSALQQGNRFVQKPYTSETLLDRVTSALDQARRPMVLVVDDDSNIRRMLRESLEEGGYAVIETAGVVPKLALTPPGAALLGYRRFLLTHEK
jgi:FixJ family two-component response regulator